MKHHLTAYIQGKDLLSTTALALTHKCKVPHPSVHSSSCIRRLNLATNPYVDTVPHLPLRLIHNPYILETEYPYKEYHQLLMEQQHIGWDNFLCEKISKQWRIYQHKYEQTQNHHQRILKRLRELQNPSLLKKKNKKKKKPPNIFQTIIGSILTAVREEMWTQCNKDHHSCNNRTSATTVEKIDKQVQFLYNKIDSVLTYKRDKYFPITLDQRLQQLLKKKSGYISQNKRNLSH